MSTSIKIKGAVAFLITDALLWLGLSPRFGIKLWEKKVFERFGEPGSMEALRAFSSCENFPVSFSACDKTPMQGWFYRGSSDKVIIYNMGRNSDLGKSLANAMVMVAAGASVFTYEYRGFGSTVGKPSLRKILADGLTAYDYVHDVLGYNSSDIIVYGESLGSGVASYVTEHRQAAGLVLQSGFASFEDLSKSQQPWMNVFPSWLYPSQRMDNRARVTRKHPPLLVVHGEKDSFIPPSQSQKVFDSALEPKALALLPNSGHRDMAAVDWNVFVGALTKYLASLN